MRLKELYLMWQDWEYSTDVQLYTVGYDFIAHGRACELLPEYGKVKVDTFGWSDSGNTLIICLQCEV